MACELLAARTFSVEDQQRFAELSGDFNPMHMDPVFARRTQAGAPVVHGIHTLLWLIDAISARHSALAPMADFRVRFVRIVYVGDTVEAQLIETTGTELCAQIVADGAVAVDLQIAFGPAKPATAAPVLAGDTVMPPPERPMEPTIDEMATMQGTLAFASQPEMLALLYPHAARVLGPHAAAALASSSLLVGMVMPGLHSLYGSLAFSLCTDRRSNGLAFKTTQVLPRFSRIRAAIAGGGIFGQLEAFIRRPPTRQADMATLAALLSKDEFAGAEVLVIGGSRGLGELTANLAAAGGARVTITYAAGAAEAEEVASRIRGVGGACKTIHFDALGDADRQLESLGTAPSHVYYFATPAIFRQRSRLFSKALFDEFNAFYVLGFHALVQACARKRPEGVSFFYPSTVAVDGPPSNLLEYAMSKAAGELLCAAIRAQEKKMRVLVSRLPRLPTDQTSTLLPVHAEDPVQTMLPIVREVQNPKP